MTPKINPGGEGLDLAPLPNETEITVCSDCLHACCWQGTFMCDEARGAGTVIATVGFLRKLGRENESYWRNSIVRRSQVSGGEGAPADSEELATCLGCGKIGVMVDSHRIPAPDAEPDEYCAECGSPDIFDTPEEAVQAAAKELSKLAPAVPDALTWTREKPKEADYYWVRIRSGAKKGNVDLGIRLVVPEEWNHPLGGTWYEFHGPIPEPREAPPMNEGGVK